MVPCDITKDEEAQLPLPDNWASQYSSSINQVIYRNVNTGVESFEHPYILQAMSAARKQPLPPDWLVKEVKLANGSIDYFYSNSVLNISMWDPPTLRHCLVVCLQNQGLKGAAQRILDGGNSHSNSTIKSETKSSVEIAYENYLDSVKQSSSPNKQTSLEEVYKYYQENNNNNSMSNTNDKNYDDSREEIESETAEQDVSIINEPTILLNSRLEDRVDKHERQRYIEKWKQLHDAYQPKVLDLRPKTHRLEKSRPPKTYAGLKVLDCDVKFAVKRVNELLVKLRVAIAEKSGLNCKVLNLSALSSSSLQKVKENIYIESCRNLAFELRKRPDIIIGTLSGIKDGSPIRMHIGFIVLHKLLHPFSSDNSLTTSLLLEAIKLELTELSPIESMFDSNGRDIRNRALFITDPATAYHWNVLAQPLPLMPNVSSETLTASLLKLYAIRRDVSSFFRSLWKPVFPSASAILSQERPSMSTFPDLVAVANRILECVLSDSAALIYPATASAICKTFHNIGGNVLMHIYMLDFLILPNMMKIFGNVDLESIENEISYDENETSEFCNKFFDLNTWWPIEGYDTVPFNPLHSLLWIVWRLYTGATHIDDSGLSNLKTSEFFRGGPLLDTSGVADAKLRIILARLQHKLLFHRQHLLNVPLDSEACKYLNIDHKLSIEEFKGKQSLSQMTLPPKLIQQRLLLVHSKAYDMSTFNILSRKEATTLFAEVNIMLESSEHRPENSVFDKDLGDFFRSNINIEKNGEDLMILMTSSSGDYDNFESTSDDTMIPWDKLRLDEQQFFQETKNIVDTFYHQLCRSLTLANKYEDTLLHMIQNIDSFFHRTLQDLVESDENHAKLERNALENDIPQIAKKHTHVSAIKVKQTHYGLHSFAKKEAKLRKYKPETHDISRQAQFHQFSNTFRFTAEDSSHPDLTVISQKNNYVNRKPTKIEVNPSSRFLVPTESEKYKAVPPPSTHKDNEREYMTSLRTHEPLSQGDYSFRRSKNRRFIYDNSSVGSSSAQSTAYGRTAKPFPEHLRYRIRDAEGIEDRFLEEYDDIYEDERIENASGRRNNYKYVFTPVGRRPADEDYDLDNDETYEYENVDFDEGNNNSRYLLPTKSLLQKLSNSEPSSKFYQAVHEGRLLLREPSNINDEIEVSRRRQSFKPSLLNIVPSNGPRAIKVKGEPENVQSKSRSPSPIRSRSPGKSPRTKSKSPMKNRERAFFADNMDRTTLKLNERMGKVNEKITNELPESFPLHNDVEIETVDNDIESEQKESNYPSVFYNDEHHLQAVSTESKEVLNSADKEDNHDIEDADTKYIADKDSNNPNIEMEAEVTNSNVPSKPIITSVLNPQRDVEVLLKGISVTKYHRNGGNKQYTFKFIESEQKLVWVNDSTNSFFTSSKKDKDHDSSIKITDITEIRKGRNTEVFAKALTADPLKALSIITNERSLDLVFSTVKERDVIARALENILTPI